MDQRLRSEYLKLRAKHPRYEAKTCLAIARSTLKAEAMHGLDESWEQDGFEVRTKWRYDEDPDLSYLGEVSDDWAEGAVKFENRTGRFDWRYKDHLYFHPQPGCTARDHVAWLRREHGRHEAWVLAESFVRQDMKRLLTANTHWSTIGVIVTVHKEGIELGHASLWGNEQSYDDEADAYIKAEVIPDLIEEALDEAKATLERLCVGRCA